LPVPYVALDTNIWRSNLLLRTPLGAALLFILRQSSGRLVFPEVVEAEIKKLILQVGLEATAKVSENFHVIEMIVGSRPNVKLPTQKDLEEAVAIRLTELEGLLLPVATTSEHLLAALRKVMSDAPPNGPGREQFKDSLIWEEILEIEKKTGDDIYFHFVCNDRDYYEDRDISKGLAKELRAEVGTHFRIHSDLRKCLESIREKAAPLDKDDLSKEIAVTVALKVKQYASEEGMRLGQLTKSSVEGFLTEKVDKLALAFTLIFGLVHADRVGCIDDAVEVVGEAIYEQREKVVSQIELESISLKWRTADGVPRQSRILMATMVFGGKTTIDYQFRERLPI